MGFHLETALVRPGGDSPADELCNALEAEGAVPSLVLVFASPSHSLSAVMSRVHARFPEATCLGATTAGELTEHGDAKRAIAGVAVTGDFRVRAGIGSQLGDDPEAAVRTAIGAIPAQLAGFPQHRTALILLDPLTGRGEEATLLTSLALGSDVPIVGGAAGDDLEMTRAEVALGTSSRSDSIVVAVLFSREPLAIGACHGHVPLSRRYRVTRAAGSVVFELDGRPAWDVWVEETRRSASIDPAALREDEVGAFLLRYEAGLAAGDSHTIRAPLSRGVDGSLSFACGIPEGAELVITSSTPDQQIESARRAAARAKLALGDRAAAGAIVFDCICRNLILGKDFERAVSSISNELGGARLAGFQTYGEIALTAGDLSGFHNTTTVVLAFPA